MANILVCDDDKAIAEAIEIYLQQEGHHVLKAYDGEQAIKTLRTEAVDLLIIDVMMPKLDGIRATLKIREENPLPIIILSAKSEDADKILGLNVGADDYITKPFNPIEVLARVKSQLRRYMTLGGGEVKADTISLRGIELSEANRKVTVDGNPICLTPKEFEILRFFMKHPNHVYSPTDIYENIWHESSLSKDGNTVAVHIRHLREKIEIDPANPRILKVVFGQGYILEN